MNAPCSVNVTLVSLSTSANKPEEKPPSHLSALGSDTLTSQSATALDPSNPSYRNYFIKIQAELSVEKSPAVSYNTSDEKCIGYEVCKWMLNSPEQICGKIIPNCLTGSHLSFFLHHAALHHCSCVLLFGHFVSFNNPPQTFLSFKIYYSCLSPLSLMLLIYLLLFILFLLSTQQEFASIRRRERLVREAIVGKSPGVYSQRFKRFITSGAHSNAF